MTVTILFFLFDLVRGYSTFSSDCTTPTSLTNYVSSPNTRGTLDILWSCFFTIIACTWTVQHLNVPEQPNEQDSRDQRWYETRRGLRSLWRSTEWMLITIVAPEYILGKALADLYAAFESKGRMSAFAKEDGVEWSLTHGFFANMGGFVLSQHCLEGNQNDRYASPAYVRVVEWAPGRITMNQVDGDPVYVMMPNNTWETSIRTKNGAQISFRYQAPFHLLASNIVWLRRQGVLSRLPHIHVSKINDRSKGDALVKLIAAFQIFWFILQVIQRARQQLSISQLEVAVTAFGVCAMITYLLLLKKPKGVDVPITLIEFRRHIPIASDQFGPLRQRRLQGYLRGLFALGEEITHHVDVAGSHIPDDTIATGPEVVVLHVGVGVGGVIFGAIHVAAWNSTFPSPSEQLFWRVASILSTALLPVMYIPLVLNEFVLRLPQKIIKGWNIGFGILYVLARAFLLVEIFRALLFLPPDTYLTSWPSNVPHVS